MPGTNNGKDFPYSLFPLEEQRRVVAKGEVLMG